MGLLLALSACVGARDATRDVAGEERFADRDEVTADTTDAPSLDGPLPCHEVEPDPAASEFDLDCIGVAGCGVLTPGAACGCGLCHQGRCLALADPAACAARPPVLDGQASVSLADACLLAGGGLTLRLTAAARVFGHAILLGGTAVAARDARTSHAFLYFPDDLSFGWHRVMPATDSPAVAAILPLADDRYLVARSPSAWRGDASWVIETVPASSLFDAVTFAEVPSDFEVSGLAIGASGDVRVLVNRVGGPGWRLSSFVPGYEANVFAGVVD